MQGDPQTWGASLEGTRCPPALGQVPQASGMWAERDSPAAG